MVRKVIEIMIILTGITILSFISTGGIFAKDIFSFLYSSYTNSNGQRSFRPQGAIDLNFSDKTEFFLKYNSDLDTTTSASKSYRNYLSNYSSRYAVDSLTGATSVDVISRATLKFNDNRSDILAGFKYKLSDSAVSYVSFDSILGNDFKSNTLSLAVNQNIFSKKTWLLTGVNRSTDEIFLANNVLKESSAVYSFDFALAHIFSPNTLARIGYTYTQNPGSASFSPSGSYISNDITFLFYQHLFTASGILLNYRYFNDTSDIGFHTIGLVYYHKFNSLLKIWPEVHYYTESGFNSTQGGLSVSYALSDNWELNFKYSKDYYNYTVNGTSGESDLIQLGLKLYSFENKKWE